ncbi:MAG: head-tail connector protein [Pseudomonadota bacterium]|nr:head-tail connector protein [Pseudomonadota bacterium]
MPEPVTLSEIKVHLRIDEDVTDEDEALANMIVAARRTVELRTRRTIVGPTPTLIDDDLEAARHAIKLLVGAMYADREGGKEPALVGWILETLIAFDDGSQP